MPEARPRAVASIDRTKQLSVEDRKAILEVIDSCIAELAPEETEGNETEESGETA